MPGDASPEPGPDENARSARAVADEVDTDPAARGAVYAAFAPLVDEPDRDRHRSLSTGAFADGVREAVNRTALDVAVPDARTDLGYEELCARYNDLFHLGHAEYEDRTDGTLSSTGPPVPVHESSYRDDASWNDVNVDLMRAYDHFGVAVDRGERRRHHDHGRLLLEFMAYLCRREAAVDPGVSRARLDFADRHLHVLTGGMADALAAEPGADVYEPLFRTLHAVVEADRAALAEGLSR